MTDVDTAVLLPQGRPCPVPPAGGQREGGHPVGLGAPGGCSTSCVSLGQKVHSETTLTLPHVGIRMTVILSF